MGIPQNTRQITYGIRNDAAGQRKNKRKEKLGNSIIILTLYFSLCCFKNPPDSEKYKLRLLEGNTISKAQR